MRCLHLGSSMVQSAMLLKAPNDLQLVYTQYMMGFLLFHPHPRDILMIGLGGGSLAKFVYHQPAADPDRRGRNQPGSGCGGSQLLFCAG